MSARAAWRLESLGFNQVYRYTAGKADWSASGLPMEGELAGVPRAGTLDCEDVPTCLLTERIGAVQERVRSAGWDVCVVVNEERVVLGLLHGKLLDADPQAFAEEVMQSGPPTVRPDLPPEQVIEYMKKRDSILVTTSDGELLGLLRREDVEQVMEDIEWGEDEVAE